MENPKPKVLSLLEAASRHAGKWAGMTAATGKGIAQASITGTAALGNLLRRPVPSPGPACVARTPHASNAPAGEANAAETARRGDGGQMQGGALASVDASVVREPVPTPDEVGEAQPELTSAVTALRKEGESLASEIERVRSEAAEAAARGNALKSQAADPQADLAATPRQAEEARGAAAETESALRSQLNDLQEERASLLAAVQKSRSEREEAAVREGLLKTRIGELERELDAARRDLREARSAAETLRSQLEAANARLSSVLRTIPAEDETSASDRGAGAVGAVPFAHEVGDSSAPAAVPPDAGADVVGRRQQYPPATATSEVPSPPNGLAEGGYEADFPDAATKVLFRRALSDMASRNMTVRANAARALSGIRHELSARVLVAQVARESSPQVRQECIKALTALEMSTGRPAVENALEDPAVVVRLAAVRGIYRLAGAESAPALTRMLSDDADEVRRRAASCLGWLGREEHAVALLPLLADRSVAVRRAALEAAVHLRSRRAIAALIERLNDPERSIQDAALSALDVLTGKKMGRSTPNDEESRERLMARWRAWWQENDPCTHHMSRAENG